MEPHSEAAVKSPLLVRRLAAGLSRERLAVAAGVTSKTVFNIERGLVEPNEATLRVLAQALGCDVADLSEPDEVAV